MSISNLSGLGEMSNKGNQLYYYTIFFKSLDNKKAGVFNFVTSSVIETKGELIQYINDNGQISGEMKVLNVMGSYIDEGLGFGHIGVIVGISSTSNLQNIYANYSYFDDNFNSVTFNSYNFINDATTINKCTI